MAAIKLVTDGAAVQAFMRSPSGPILRDLLARGERVKLGARERAPHKTGCLESSIVKRFEEDPVHGFVVRVVADTTPCSPDRTSYALWVHDGTDPHIILPKTAKALRFEIGGEVIFAGSVNHPGSKAQPFLKDALPLAA